MESNKKLKIKNELNGYMLDEINYNEERFIYIYVKDEKKKNKIVVTFSLVCHGIKITSSESEHHPETHPAPAACAPEPILPDRSSHS